MGNRNKEEIESLLMKALEEKFRSISVVDSVVEVMCSHIETKIMDKYKANTYFHNGLEFELFGVNISKYGVSIKDQTQSVELVLFCKSKLPKIKMEKIEEVKKTYRDKKYLNYNSYKIPLWYRLSYNLDLRTAYSNEINLNIDLK